MNLKPARDRREWIGLSRASGSEYIRSLADFDCFVGEAASEQVLRSVSRDVLATFRSTLVFAELRLNGVVDRQCLVEASFEDLVSAARLTDDDVLSILQLFGVGPELAAATYHRFGDIGPDGERICRPRRYRFCMPL